MVRLHQQMRVHASHMPHVSQGLNHVLKRVETGYQSITKHPTHHWKHTHTHAHPHAVHSTHSTHSTSICTTSIATASSSSHSACTSAVAIASSTRFTSYHPPPPAPILAPAWPSICSPSLWPGNPVNKIQWFASRHRPPSSSGVSAQRSANTMLISVATSSRYPRRRRH